HGSGSAGGHPEPGRGTKWWAQTFWLLLGRLPKVTRRKGGTNVSRFQTTDMYAKMFAPLHNAQRPPEGGLCVVGQSNKQMLIF
ncbi:hypothetical protein, partial [Pseudomonas maioricensis]|uniref:hypothetical protein n=1 Tax=Pseudomonas maioricensis TaxID=1766623 RepID=UPI001FAC36A3